MFDLVKENLKKIYKHVELDDNIIIDAINNSLKLNLNSYIDIMFAARKYIESYLIENHCNVVIEDDILNSIEELEGKNDMKIQCNNINKNEIDNSEIEMKADDITMIDCNNKEKYDISFLKLYLKKIEITQSYLAEELDVSRIEIYRWLNGIRFMPGYYLPKLLKIVKSNSYNELRKLVIDIYKYVPYVKNIDKNLLFRLTSMLDSSSNEYIIVQMLFGGFKERCYSIEEIAKVLSISKEYVLDIYYKYMNIISIMEKVNNDNQVYLLSMNTLK